MYVCICKRITESMVKDGNDAGLGTVCGKCKSASGNKVMKVVLIYQLKR